MKSVFYVIFLFLVDYCFISILRVNGNLSYENKNAMYTAVYLRNEIWTFTSHQKTNNVFIIIKGNTLLQFNLDSSQNPERCTAKICSSSDNEDLLRESNVISMTSSLIDTHFPRFIQNRLKLDNVNFDDMTKMCTNMKSSDLSRNKRSSGSWAIFPGTKWCGAGNIAHNESDYGADVETDKCCHKHDRCKDYIRKFETKYGYTNKTPFTLSNCDCDDDFFACLRIVGTDSATNVGYTFFNILKMKCFTVEEAHVCINWVLNMWCAERGWVMRAIVHDALPWK